MSVVMDKETPVVHHTGPDDDNDNDDDDLPSAVRNKTPPRNSLLGYLQRRFLGGAKLGLGSSLRRLNVGSCPNIPRTMDKPEIGKALLPGRLPLGSSNRTDPNKLHVPNFFITSQTHSKEWKMQCCSSPDLGHKPERPVLRKAVSVTSAFETLQRESRYFYRDSHITQVLDFLFLGDIYSAYNPHVLCRLGIKRIVDISDTRPQEVPAHIKSLCSCTCRPDVKHSRPKLYIDVEKDDSSDIGLFFHEINRFIETARVANAKVLVHSYDGMNRGPCAVAQYLMGNYNMDLRTACRWVHKCRPCANMTSESIQALKAWEIRCVPCEDATQVLDASLNRKMAWSDC